VIVDTVTPEILKQRLLNNGLDIQLVNIIVYHGGIDKIADAIALGKSITKEAVLPNGVKRRVSLLE
jgi:hypothetical protein